MSVLEDLQALIEPLVTDLGYEFVGIEYQSNPKNRVVRLYIDQPGGDRPGGDRPDSPPEGSEDVGITVDDCAVVSREVSALMDVEDPVKGHYTLEVSSPGIERPLFTAEHYRRFVGETALIHLHAPAEGRRKFRGRITGADEEVVTLALDDPGKSGPEEVRLDLGNIRKAHLVPDLDALLAEG